MIVYYTADFSGGREESHRLLEDVIMEYTGDRKRARAMIAGMRTGAKGKPFIDGFAHFSISHSEGVWAVLVSERECGLDIQHVKKCSVISIAKRFYHPDDACAVEHAHRNDPVKGEDEFFRLWTRREALVKAYGGSVADSRIPSVSPDRADCRAESFALRDITLPEMPELYAAICVKGDEPAEEPEFRKMADIKNRTKKTAAEAAYSYLANRMRTTEEVRRYLEGRDHSDDEITETINELIGMRYLDDYLYAVRYYEHNREKKRGTMRAERELIGKGIDRETARNAREDFLCEQEVDEYEDALEIAKKEAYRPSDIYGEPPVLREIDDRLTAKIARKLESKGFSRGDIFRALDEIRRLGNED